MITITVLATGQVFSSMTFEQNVGKLWKSTWLTDSSPGQYMKAAAARAKIQRSAEVRSDTAEHFLRDLETAGLISITEGRLL